MFQCSTSFEGDGSPSAKYILNEEGCGDTSCPRLPFPLLLLSLSGFAWNNIPLSKPWNKWNKMGKSLILLRKSCSMTTRKHGTLVKEFGTRDGTNMEQNLVPRGMEH
jgi:hypothetical protein